MSKIPKYNQPNKTWQYTKDFKVKAVKLSYQDGIQVQQVAEGLDIHPMMLSRWKKKYYNIRTAIMIFL
ncbi:MAG: transposase [Kangiellaceae bacterium]|nr:transposase [Kangiellaceae bacterium]